MVVANNDCNQFVAPYNCTTISILEAHRDGSISSDSVDFEFSVRAIKRGYTRRTGFMLVRMPTQKNPESMIEFCWVQW